ncbi:PREDICTED: protodermal factor 1-like isoform X2 [Lupinus angustifolius]|uniref:protodermal factor 1-like isoform X2 n=1 Tax=Lupinus angustifolius TaxID=3871 RepID=UPI00092F24CC|nr:PREDICTED: protodermal factor 1-like isoform X2 [Lupinus angustifolius]
MERKISHVFLTIFLMLAGLLSQNHVICTNAEDQKNYFSSDSHAGTPPTGSHRSPPSHGSGGSSPPSHGTPSHAPSGGNCGSPLHDPSTPTTPSNPPSGGGGYYNSPPPYGGGNPPTPITVTPPTTPIDPDTPTLPSPPFLPSPSPLTGTCNYWSTHPTIIWGLLGWWGTLGSAFGVPGSSSSVTLPQALSNTRNDGVGALYREGTASYLNSLVNNNFPYTTNQVRERFVASLNSNKAATTQAKLFKMANEGRMKP